MVSILLTPLPVSCPSTTPPQYVYLSLVTNKVYLLSYAMHAGSQSPTTMLIKSMSSTREGEREGAGEGGGTG